MPCVPLPPPVACPFCGSVETTVYGGWAKRKVGYRRCVNGHRFKTLRQ